MRVEITTHNEWYWLVSHSVPSTESGCFIDNEVRLSELDLLHLWIVEEMGIANDDHLFGPIVAK